ncbi:hypothetical protein THRCLA_20142 [Thraustotheca clavata]|uniref:ZNF380 coiled-coil domain-containing protein n=1 Tax=Thraustotheca clavata TaxID=74557 RepID=A0A1W0AB45_9STRA|nr:hypothetical protein THRCLA_20142 [Thraustotheca clavata]
MSNKRKALPVGFFDDALADAKARKIDIEEQVKKVQEKEWADFQSFVASVETTERQDDQSKADEALEEEGLEKLKQMEYLDRVRKALVRASRKENGQEEKKEEVEIEIAVKEDDEEESVDQALAKGLQARMNRKKIEDNNSDDDLLNWRARRY